MAHVDEKNRKNGKTNLVSLNTRDQEGNTPMEVASVNGHEEIVECLLKSGASFFVRALDFAIEINISSIIDKS